MTNGTISASCMTASPSFDTFTSIQQIYTPIGILIWIIICIVKPYTWRGFQPRDMTFGYYCPSIYLAIAGYCGILLFALVCSNNNIIHDEELVGKDNVAIDIKHLFKVNAYSFVVVHLFMIILRYKYTIAKWQALVFCEIGKTSFVVVLIWGSSRLDECSYLDPSSILLIIGCSLLFVFISCFRLYWLMKSNFNGIVFNDTYFGADKSQCPVQSLLCLVLDEKIPVHEPANNAAYVSFTSKSI